MSSSFAASENVFSGCILTALSGMIYAMMEKDCSVFLVDPENLARAAGAVIQIDISCTALRKNFRNNTTRGYPFVFDLPDITWALTVWSVAAVAV